VAYLTENDNFAARKKGFFIASVVVEVLSEMGHPQGWWRSKTTI
jgi:hypothetical protein